MPRDACLDEASASAFVAGELPVQLRQTIEVHVDDCGSCRQLLAALIRRAGPEAAAWAPGRRVGRYVVGERIGKGGMGTVFRADDVELGRAIALKRLEPGVDREILLREARAAAQLSHPNVVTVHEVGEDDGAPFLAMELVDGATLAAWLRAERRSWHAIVSVLAQAGRGLAAAHERGLVHRDFKPENVLVDRTGRARVADFGLARVAPTAVQVNSDVPLAPTTATLAGTPAYLAPELIEGAAPDARSDQYAFGVTLFEALHGRHPFAGTTAEAMWAEMAAGKIRAGDREVPAWLERHVRRALAVEPAERWPSVAELVAALEQPPRKKWPWLAGAAGLAAAGALAVVAFGGRKAEGCERAGELVDRVWSQPVRQAQLLGFAAAAPLRADTIASAVRIVDGWTGEWKLGIEATCRVDPAQRAARQGCLDRQLADLRAQLATWATPDAAMVDHAVAAAAALPHPSECAAHPPPLDRAPQGLVDRIASLAALERVGRAREAKPAIAGILADVTALGDPLTSARALVVAGMVERELGDLPQARLHDATAAREAGRAGDDALTLKALLEEAQAAIDAGHSSEALGMCDAADALVARAHLDSEQRVAVTRGDALSKLGRTPEAIRELEKAIAILEPRAARDSSLRLELAAVYGAVGTALGAQFKLEEAHAMLARALAIEEPEHGKDHPEVGRTLHDMANQEVPLGKLDDAAAHYTRARQIFAAAYGETSELVGGCDIGLGHVARARQQYAEARKAYERARANLARSIPADHPDNAVIEESLAACDRDEDRSANAVPHFERAIAIRERAGLTGGDLADDHIGLGSALYEIGRDADARVHAERGLALMEELGTEPAGRCNGWQLLAELEANAGHRARAVELARKIVAALGNDPREDWTRMREIEQARIAEWSK